MPSFNRVILMGNLTRDPQLKHLPNNLVVAEFGLACNRKYRTAAGDDREDVAFVDCSAFGRQAETIGQYCSKGKPLFVEGHLKFDSWDDKSGNGKRSKLTVVVDNFQFIGDRTGGDSSPHADPPHNDDDVDQRPQERSDRWNGESPPAGRQRRRGTAQQPFGEEKQFTEADIPF